MSKRYRVRRRARYYRKRREARRATTLLIGVIAIGTVIILNRLRKACPEVQRVLNLARALPELPR